MQNAIDAFDIPKDVPPVEIFLGMSTSYTAHEHVSSVRRASSTNVNATRPSKEKTNHCIACFKITLADRNELVRYFPDISRSTELGSVGDGHFFAIGYDLDFHFRDAEGRHSDGRFSRYLSVRVNFGTFAQYLHLYIFLVHRGNCFLDGRHVFGVFNSLSIADYTELGMMSARALVKLFRQRIFSDSIEYDAEFLPRLNLNIGLLFFRSS